MLIETCKGLDKKVGNHWPKSHQTRDQRHTVVTCVKNKGNLQIVDIY